MQTADNLQRISNSYDADDFINASRGHGIFPSNGISPKMPTTQATGVRNQIRKH